MDDDGPGYAIRLAVTVEGDEITFDYTGTHPQTPRFVNAPYTSAASATLVTLLLCVGPRVPHNSGIMRPVHINIPEGTMLNAQFPAATFFGNKLCEHNGEAIMQASPRRSLIASAPPGGAAFPGGLRAWTPGMDSRSTISTSFAVKGRGDRGPRWLRSGSTAWRGRWWRRDRVGSGL